jgi:uncharacterized membrane protein
MEPITNAISAPENETPDQRDIRLNKDVAAFSYVWIMSVVVFASRRDSPFAQYHSKQACILFLLSIPVAMIPFLGRYLVFIVLAGMLLGFINAANGRREELPFVGKLATGEMKPKDIWNQTKPYMDKLVHIFAQMFKKPDHPVEKNAAASAAAGKPAATPAAPAQPPAPAAPTVSVSSTPTPPPASPLDNSTPKP